MTYELSRCPSLWPDGRNIFTPVILKPKDRDSTLGVDALSATSILLPKMGGAGKLSVSPATGSGASRLEARLMVMVDGKLLLQHAI